ISESGLVSRVSPVQTALRNCTRDEGRSFEVGNQVLISSHRKLLSSTLPMRMAASWFGSPGPPDTRLWRDSSAPESELPSDRHPYRTKRAVVLGAVKVWPSKGGACG